MKAGYKTNRHVYRTNKSRIYHLKQKKQWKPYKTNGVEAKFNFPISEKISKSLKSRREKKTNRARCKFPLLQEDGYEAHIRRRLPVSARQIGRKQARSCTNSSSEQTKTEKNEKLFNI